MIRPRPARTILPKWPPLQCRRCIGRPGGHPLPVRAGAPAHRRRGGEQRRKPTQTGRRPDGTLSCRRRRERRRRFRSMFAGGGNRAGVRGAGFDARAQVARTGRRDAVPPFRRHPHWWARPPRPVSAMVRATSLTPFFDGVGSWATRLRRQSVPERRDGRSGEHEPDGEHEEDRVPGGLAVGGGRGHESRECAADHATE